MTENMKKFIAKNKTVKVVEGERLTPEGNSVENSTDLFRSDRVKYRFTDGERAVLLTTDTKSAPGFKPAWDH